MEKKIAVCNLCEAICGVELTIEDGNVTGVRGNPDDPFSRGHICPKGTALADVYADPDRLRRPVRRVTTDRGTEWVEISWDEALDEVTDRLAATIQEHGRDAVATYLGNPNVHSLGALLHAPMMIKSIGSRNTFSATSVDQLPHHLVSFLMYGHQLVLPVPDIDRTEFFLIFGGNPMASNGSLMTVPDFPNRVRALKARGGRMVVFDPRRTETAKVATEHHFIRPGTDAFVLLAMVNELFAEGLTRPAGYVDGVAEVEAAVRPFTAELAQERSGVPAELIRQVTREFAAAGCAAAYGRIGVSTQEFGSLSQWAIQCLNILTGNLDRPGGTMLTEPAIDIVQRGLFGRGHFGKWKSRVKGLPEFGSELPVSTLSDEIETPGEGQVRALVTVAGNPVSSTPDGGRLDRAMAGLDFMAAVDIYVNETTRHADIILPPTTILERDHYDLAFHVLAIRNTARFTPAVFEKPADAMHDWEIFREIGLRVARKTGRSQTWKQWVTTQVRLRLRPRLAIDVLLRTGASNLSVRKLLKNPAGVDLGPLRPTLPGRLMTRDKRIAMAPQLLLDDLARLQESASTVASDDELLLIGRRHKSDCNSWMHNSERLTKGRDRHQLLMHPDDLASRDLTDGARVQVMSQVGKVEVEVAASDEMMRGVVSLPHGWGQNRDGVLLSHAVGLPGVSINDLTDGDGLDVSGNSRLSGVPVRVSALI